MFLAVPDNFPETSGFAKLISPTVFSSGRRRLLGRNSKPPEELNRKKCSSSSSSGDRSVAFHSPPISLTEPNRTGHLVVLRDRPKKKKKIKVGSAHLRGPQSITINLSGIYRICAEQQTKRKGYPSRVRRSVPEVAITFPAVHSHRERPRPEKDSCQSFSSNSCSRVPRLRLMGWARVVKSRRHASLPGCGVTAGLLDFHAPKKESAVRAFGGAFGPFGLSFIHQASLSSLILSGRLTGSGSGLSASGKHLSRLCRDAT